MRNKHFPILVFVILVFAKNLNAQKVSINLEMGVLESVGKDKFKIHQFEENNYSSVSYLYRKRFENPYLKFLAIADYSLNSKIRIGIGSGFYFHISEKYFSNVKRTNVSIPLILLLDYEVLDFEFGKLGFEIGGGKIFYNIHEGLFSQKNAQVFKVLVFITNKKRSAIKFGMEKQFDNATITLLPPEYQFESFKYTIGRVSLCLSYSYKLFYKDNKN